MHVWNEIKLRWYFNEFMVNWMTLCQALEMVTALRKTHLSTSLHVVRLSQQNTILSSGNLQLDVSFQGFYFFEIFFLYTLPLR